MATGPSREIGIEPPGFRLPEATRPGRVQLQVADLDRSLSFYGDVLGLRPVDRTDGRVVLAPRDADTSIIELVERPGAKVRARRSRLGLFHVALLLPKRAFLGQFVRHLAEKEVQVGMSDHHVSEAVYLTDPDGLGIEVYADRPRESWDRNENGELAMTTEPLDTDAVLSAAAGGEWSGMPSGTSVGHVHLHVGDLGQAEDFYHGALGLDKTVWSYPGALFLSAGGYHHHLGTNVWAGDVPPAGEDEAQLLEWTLVLPEPDDVDRVARSLENAGYDAARDGDACRTEDPWGTRLRIMPADGP